MKAIRTTLPTAVVFLCAWHVAKNVLQHYKSAFTTEEAWETFNSAFHHILQSQTEEDYEERLLQFKTTYSDEQTKPAVDYIVNT